MAVGKPINIFKAIILSDEFRWAISALFIFVFLGALIWGYLETSEFHLNKISNDEVSTIASMTISVSGVVVSSFFVVTIVNFIRTDYIRKEEESKIEQNKKNIDDLSSRIESLKSQTGDMIPANKLQDDILKLVDAKIKESIGLGEETVLQYITSHYTPEKKLIDSITNKVKAEVYAELAAAIFREPLARRPDDPDAKPSA